MRFIMSQFSLWSAGVRWEQRYFCMEMYAEQMERKAISDVIFLSVVKKLIKYVPENIPSLDVVWRTICFCIRHVQWCGGHVQSLLPSCTSWAQGDTLSAKFCCVFQIGPDGNYKSYFKFILFRINEADSKKRIAIEQHLVRPSQFQNIDFYTCKECFRKTRMKKANCVQIHCM